jgi:hypothetical protein
MEGQMRILTLFLCAAVAVIGAPKRNFPVLFLPNRGQTAPEAVFMAKGRGLTAYYFRDEVIYAAGEIEVKLRFFGATGPTATEGTEPLETKANFLIGEEREWTAGVPTYRGMAYRNLYPGIDLLFAGDGVQSIKSEFVVAPGADPGQIRLEYSGAAAEVENDGSLTFRSGRRVIREAAPKVYQLRNGTTVLVDASFSASNNIVTFSLGSYDRSLPLIIDPVVYAALLGGTDADAAFALAVDSAGAAYVAGFTSSFDLPLANPAQPLNSGGNEVFVAKVNAAGSALVYCTYIGGRGDDRAFSVAVDAAGTVYVAGATTSSNFPVRSPLQARFGGGKDAFILHLSSSGNELLYSTFLGGIGSDSAQGIAIDARGNAYVTGDTTSADFPTSGAQTSYRGATDAFVAKLAPDGRQLLYSRHLGGAGTEHATAIAVDATGAVFVTGSTYSPDFPVVNAYQPRTGGGQDVFVTRVSPFGDSLLFSTYLGGSGGLVGAAEEGLAIALDAAGSVYVTGETSSTNFPALNAGQAKNAGWQDAFVAKFTSSGALVYSTYLGGANLDTGDAIAVDATGSAYVGGRTTSANLMAFIGIQNAPTGVYDGFVIKLLPSGNGATAVAVLGGAGPDNVSAIAIDAAGSVYIAGYTLSPTFPGADDAQIVNVASNGAFIMKILLAAPGVGVAVTPPAPSLYPSQQQQFTATVVGTSNAAVTWSVNPPGVGSLSASGLYTAPAAITAQQTISVTATAADPGRSSTATVTLLPAPANLARSGVATQSSTYASETTAGQAIDGNTDGNYANGSVNCTNGDPYAWWQVDLRVPATIESIVIWNRTDGSMSRLANYWVFVSDLPFTASDTPITLQRRAGTWGTQRMSYPAPSTTIQVAAKGRYVRIQLEGTNFLHMAEVQVFGTINWAASPRYSAVAANQTQQLTATGAGGSGVTWTVAPSIGTISATGLYTAPATASSIQSVTVTATSIADPSQTASATIFIVPGRSNLAPAGTASQSSQYAATTAASKAIDGNTDGNYANGSVNCTNGDPYAWWQVDLGAPATINTIVLWNRTDGSMSRLSDYWIFVSDTPFAPTDTAAALKTRAGIWSSRQNAFPDPYTIVTANARGRYVRVQLNAQNFLHMAEAQLFGNYDIAVSVSPAYATLAAQQTQTFTAAATNTENRAVIWSITPNTGSISATGVYTAPTTVSGSQTVTVKATSVADSTKSGTAVVTLAPIVNLATAGVASQSSQYAPETGAGKAIDGNTDGDYSHYSVSCTNNGPYSWWQVDLGASASINTIILWNRTDGSMARLSDYWIFVSDTPFGTTDTPASLQWRSGTWSVRQSNYPNPSAIATVNAKGRYVRVQLNTPNYLHMSEVQVFGIRAP